MLCPSISHQQLKCSCEWLVQFLWLGKLICVPQIRQLESGQSVPEEPNVIRLSWLLAMLSMGHQNMWPLLLGFRSVQAIQWFMQQSMESSELLHRCSKAIWLYQLAFSKSDIMNLWHRTRLKCNSLPKKQNVKIQCFRLHTSQIAKSARSKTAESTCFFLAVWFL